MQMQCTGGRCTRKYSCGWYLEVSKVRFAPPPRPADCDAYRPVEPPPYRRPPPRPDRTGGRIEQMLQRQLQLKRQLAGVTCAAIADKCGVSLATVYARRVELLNSGER